MIWAVLAAAGLLYLAVAAAMYLGQRRLLFAPDVARPSAAGAGVAGLQEVALVTQDGLRLLAWWLPPPPGGAVLVYFHGNGGNLDNRAPRVRAYAAAGFGMLLPEYRGFGGNPGAPSEAGFALDARAAMAFLAAQGVAPGQIVAYGESIGTGVAVRVAAEGALAALVLESPYTSIRAVAQGRYPWLPVAWLLRDPFDSLSRIGAVHVPVLMLQGGQDRVVPPAQGQALFAAAHDPKQMWLAPDAGHETLMASGAGEVVTAFVRRWVR